ncbi:unnamed protein product [Alopecurus aequalis]
MGQPLRPHHLRALPCPAPCYSHMLTIDCRHGRALFVTRPGMFLDIVVLDPLTGHERRVPSHNRQQPWFSGAVLCGGAAQGQGCDHHACQGGHFRVVLVSTDWPSRVTSGRLYSSETSVWSELTSVHHPDFLCDSNISAQSVLVGDALYFNADAIIECQLGTLRLSMLQKPIDCGEHGAVMAAEDGGLGFAAVVGVTNLTMWSSVETGPEGAVGWAKLRVIDLSTLIPHGALLISGNGTNRSSVRSSTEGAQVLFMTTCVGCDMVDLKSGRARKVSCDGHTIFPYMRFYIPAMEAACTGQGG